MDSKNKNDLPENFKIKLLDELLNVLYNSSFQKPDPIPIASVFYDLDSFEIIALSKNENTEGLMKKDKYLKHAEYLAVSSNVFEQYEEKNIGVLITIPPCEDCYANLASKKCIKKINWITHKNGEHKIHKIIKMIKNGTREIHFEKITFDSDVAKEKMKEAKEVIWKIEMWMKKS